MKTNQTSSLVSLLALSLATSPFIMSLLVLHILGEWLESIGKSSEEIFRAEQLPLLHFGDR